MYSVDMIPFGKIAEAGLEVLIVACIVLFFSITILVVIEVRFLITLFRNMKHVTPESRSISPGLVWLNMIPVFSFVWMFYTVITISESNRTDFKKRNLSGGGDFGFISGIAFCVLSCAAFIPYVGIYACIAGSAAFVVYWITIARLSSILKEAEWNESRMNRNILFPE